jgi:class 3 adenylate cyclase/TolB-like protein
MERRLAAIMAADVAGYSHLMNNDEMGTLVALKQCEEEIIEPTVKKHNGRIFKRMGDGYLVEFSSAIDCLECALEWQCLANESEESLQFRIGINLADVISEANDIYGDGVNIAARIENLAEPGEVYISQEVYNHVEKKVEASFLELGTHSLKNIEKPVDIYRVSVKSQDSDKRDIEYSEQLPSATKQSLKQDNQSEAAEVSVAILPFENISGSNEYDYFSIGFVEDLVVDLSHFRGLRVISTYTSNRLGNGESDIFYAARQVSINYLLKGSLRFSGSSLRITAQLFKTSTGNIIWTERFDAAAESVMELQDDIIGRVVSAIQSEVDLDLLAASRNKPITTLAAYDCWLRGMDKLRLSTLEADQQAREYFNQALAIDPHFSRAYAGLSLSHFNEWSCQLWELYESSEQNAYKYATKAVQLDDTDHVVQMILGRVYLFRRQFDEAEYHIERSLSLNSNDGENLVQLSTCMAFLGRTSEGKSLFKKALQLNPYRNLWYYQYGSFLYFVSKQYEKSIDLALKRPLTNVWVDLPAYIAAAHAYLGNTKAAEEYLELFINSFTASITRGHRPSSEEVIDWIKMATPFKNQSDTDNIIDGLILAGIKSRLPSSPDMLVENKN